MDLYYIVGADRTSVVFVMGRLQRALSLAYLLLWASYFFACVTMPYYFVKTYLFALHDWQADASHSFNNPPTQTTVVNILGEIVNLVGVGDGCLDFDVIPLVFV